MSDIREPLRGKPGDKPASLLQSVAGGEAPKPDAPPAAAAEAPKPAAEVVRIVKPIETGRIKLAHAADGSVMNIWCVTVPDNTPWDDVFEPNFFSNKAQEMRGGDVIRVLTDGARYEGELSVHSTFVVGNGTQPNRLHVYERFFKIVPQFTRVVNEYDLHAKWGGTHYKWALYRQGDPIPVRYGFETEEDALRIRRGMAFARNSDKPAA